MCYHLSLHFMIAMSNTKEYITTVDSDKGSKECFSRL